MLAKDRLIVTTSWDDGSVFDLKIAELLTKYGMKGTFYIPRSLFAHPLERHDIAAIDEYFEIGSHTLNHVELTKVPPSEAREEIEGSKAYLAELLGHNVNMFCYPNNKYNRDIVNMVRKSGYIAARTTNNGGFTLPPDPYEWHVTMLTTDHSPLTAFKICLRNQLAFKALTDWETRAKLLFNKFLKSGGIYHIWGHSLEIELYLEWDKLERLLEHISNRDGVRYMTNGEIFSAPQI